jgi:hypothetical protein
VSFFGDAFGGLTGGLGGLFGGGGGGNPNPTADPINRGDYAAQLQNLWAHPSNVANMPGYQAGMHAVEGSAAAQGMLNSGNTLASLQNYGAGQFYNTSAMLQGLATGDPRWGMINMQQGQNLLGGLGSLFGGMGGMKGMGSSLGGMWDWVGGLFGSGGGGADAASTFSDLESAGSSWVA